jgi:predicted transcriptional regulator
MKNTDTFTSTISPELLRWLNKRAKQAKQTRRELLEDALVRYRKDVQRKNMRDGFKRAAADTSTLELAEWGMNDYSRIVKNS